MSTVKFAHELGDILKEKVTGFKGAVMVRAEYATGCHHYGLLSQTLKDGKPQDWEWFDQSQLEKAKGKKIVFDIPKGTTSGPMPKGPQR